MHAGDWEEQGGEAKNKLADIPQLVLEPKRLLELLHICTLITQGQKPLSFFLLQKSIHCPGFSIVFKCKILTYFLDMFARSLYLLKKNL